MNYKNAVAEMRKYFKDHWANLTPLGFDDLKLEKADNVSFARLNIQHFLGFQASIGAPSGNMFRRAGVITVQIFVPEGTGSVEAREKAEFAQSAYIGQDTGEILYYDTTIVEVGNDGFGFYQINVKANFEYDTIA